MVSKNCIFLYDKKSDDQIWIDYGEFHECRDFYFYENNKYTMSAFFSVYNGLLLITSKYSFEMPYCWNYEKTVEENSIKINGIIYYIDENNITQIILFKNTKEKWFKYLSEKNHV